MVYKWKNLQVLHLPKTAGSQLRSILLTVLKGEMTKTRNIHAPTKSFDRFTVMTIRNPYAMYVSEWGYGHDGKGSIYSAIINKCPHCKANGLSHLYKERTPEGFQKWLKYVFKRWDCLMDKRYRKTSSEQYDKVDFWIHQESFEKDVIKMLSVTNLDLIPNWKEKVSQMCKRYKFINWKEYYTQDLLDEVYKRDKLLFDRHKCYTKEVLLKV